MDILRPASVRAGECCNAQRNSVEGIMSKHFSCGNLCEGAFQRTNYNHGCKWSGSNPDVRFLSGPWTGLPVGHGFLSGRGIRGSVRNWPNFIRTVLRHVRKFWPIFIRTYLRHLRVLSGVLLKSLILPVISQILLLQVYNCSEGNFKLFLRGDGGARKSF